MDESLDTACVDATMERFFALECRTIAQRGVDQKRHTLYTFEVSDSVFN